MKSEKGRGLHGIAADLREKGESINSLKADIDAIVAYATDGDRDGLSEIFSEMFLSFKHLSQKDEIPDLTAVAAEFGQLSARLSERFGLKTGLGFRLLHEVG